MSRRLIRPELLCRLVYLAYFPAPTKQSNLGTWATPTCLLFKNQVLPGPGCGVLGCFLPVCHSRIRSRRDSNSWEWDLVVAWNSLLRALLQARRIRGGGGHRRFWRIVLTWLDFFPGFASHPATGPLYRDMQWFKRQKVKTSKEESAKRWKRQKVTHFIKILKWSNASR
jgi:hypothetical protein